MYSSNVRPCSQPGSPSVSHPPLEPARPGWGRDILFDYRGSHAVDETQPPAPSTSSTTLLDGLSTANAGTAVQQGAPLAPYARVADPASPPPAARGAYQPPAPPSIKIDATARRGNASPGLPTPTSLPPGGSPNPSISRISTPDTDLLTASVITSVDAFFTPQTVSLSPSALRTRTPSPAMSPALTASPSISIDVLSADSSRPGSPFSDVSASLSALGLHLNQSNMAGAQAQTNPFSSPEDPLSLPSSPSVLGGPDELLSPPSILGDLQSEMDFHSFAGDDDDLFSVPSSTGSDEDDFDDMSAVGSDASSWAGIGQHGSTRG
ncbi:hypothetical protein BV25DRAFT_1621353 [Artomyces pyxidatus]|uniref:Uncharacterized protein n=1 Tax=Artomyces pyxidatus TaxID=48021 RepID=A0ACB8TC12_9AGAM|nr:hypothetical protein BV25DRAFT_1621353 [Artomyces pyxidatus]